MTGRIQKLLTDLKHGLKDLYGERLQSLYLYGSYARAEQQWDSDVDVLIVLNQIDSYGTEIDRTSNVVSTLSLQYGVSISRVFVSAEAWQEKRNSFLSTVREESIVA